MEKFDFYIPTRVLFGPGKLDELAAAKLPGQKALIVTTAGKSVKKYGYYPDDFINNQPDISRIRPQFSSWWYPDHD